ncbi:cuticle protein 12.5-like [Sabethes cyaneus]|uniref:cuticle protein 12.5-like n=1 Tax=Sabethes cyaneus TaxID=53552 RepID=UPI00237EBD35|nr:cuticle protein 12.5-like [Sabethes cyaneus]
MFRLVVLSVVLAVAAAAPSATVIASAPLAYTSYAAVPAVVAQKEIAYQKSIIEEPAIAHVGNIEKKIPTGFSHQSFTQYHNKQVAEEVFAPAVKKTIVETPVEKTTYHTVNTPALHTTYVQPAPAVAYAAAPIAKAAYVEAAPALTYAAAPAYTAYAAGPAYGYAAAPYTYAASYPSIYSGYPCTPSTEQ